MIFGTASKWRKEITIPVCDEEDIDEPLETPKKLRPCVQEQLSLPIPAVEKGAAEEIKPSVDREPYLKQWGLEIVIVQNPSQMLEALPRLIACPNVLGIDTETYALPEFKEDKQGGLDPRKSNIRLLQLYDGDKTVYVFDLLKLGGLAVMGAEFWEKPMIAHNARFELKHLLHKGIFPKNLGCTLLADRVLNGDRKSLKETLGLSRNATLKDLAKELLGLDISKEEQTSDWSQETLTKEQLEYAALDAVLPIKLFAIQRKLLVQRELEKSYKILRDAQYPVDKMELAGIGFNAVAHRELIAKWQAESEVLATEILGELGQELNINSSKQMAEWLRDNLKDEDLEAWSKTGKGQLSTSTPTFKLNEQRHDVFPKIVAYRHLVKRLSSFGDNLYKFIDLPSSRLYGSFSLGTTATGRMASSKPNMQNMPRNEFRHLFCAREGFSLVGLDYSQQELRVAALVTGDKELLQIYEEGGDVHKNTAASILKIPKEAVTKENRQLAKAVIFGLLYGQGAKGLARYAKQQYGVEMTEEEATKHRNGLFKTYKGLRQWQNDTGRRVEITGKIRSPCGRERDFSREINGYQYTAALNLPIQGGAAEMTLRALSRISTFLCDDCLLVNAVHDEILLEVRNDRVNEFAELAKKAMEDAFLDVFPKGGPYLKGLVEAKTGKNWAEAK